MFPLGVLLLIVSYAMVYTGGLNLANGGKGPTLAASLGIPVTIAPQAKSAPNLTGQPAAGPVQGAVGGPAGVQGAVGGGI
jgi:hypothetical protein